MIIAELGNADRYTKVHHGFSKGFEFLRRKDLATLDDGQYAIDGEQAFAIVARGFGRGQIDSPLEFHRQYIDIQYVVSGVDSIGWLPTAECRHTQTDFDAEKDLGFFRDRPKTWCRVPAGTFAIFFPEDAHAPLGGSGPFHKVVIKIQVR